MNREFGSYSSGYFHEQINNAASDLKAGRDPLSRLWGECTCGMKQFYAAMSAYDVARYPQESPAHE